MTYFDFIDPIKFSKIFNESDIIINHAGIGTIIKALEIGKKIVIFPRLMKFHEHRNDHQIFTAKIFDKLAYVNVALDETELLSILSHIENLKVKKTIGSMAEPEIIKSISVFINTAYKPTIVIRIREALEYWGKIPRITALLFGTFPREEIQIPEEFLPDHLRNAVGAGMSPILPKGVSLSLTNKEKQAIPAAGHRASNAG